MVGRSGLPLLVVLALFLSGCTASDEPEKVPLDGPIVVEQSSIGQKVEGFKTGPRFLQQVEWPEHIKNPPRSAPEDEKPGDGYDDGLLVTKRRHTDRSFYEKEWTPGLALTNVHGTSSNPVCVCDAEFVYENKNGESSERIIITSSSWILIDNVTIYGGGGLSLRGGHNITVTRSIFIASDGIWVNDGIQDTRIIDNDFIGHLGPTYPHSNPPSGFRECWPDPDGCEEGGIHVVRGDGTVVQHNYFDGGHGIGTTSGPERTKIHHNTFYNGARMEVSEGAAEVTWNLVRGWANALIFTAGGTDSRIENNSLVLNTQINPFSMVLSQPVGLHIRSCESCIVRNNDFIAFGYGYQANGGAPAMATSEGDIDASANYWGTLHDPRLPPDTIIWNLGGLTTLTLNNWDLHPNHDLDPIVVSPYPDDAAYWLDRVKP